MENNSIPTKRSKIVFDAVIIGGCVTGVTTALQLQKAGLKTAIVEHLEIGFQTSGCYHTHLNSYFDALNKDLVQNLDQSQLKLYAQAGEEALNFINKNIKEYNISCEFQKGKGYIFTTDNNQEKILQHILKTCQVVGCGGEIISKGPFKLPFEKIARIGEQRTLNAVKYILTLLKEYKNLNGEVLERSRVLKVEAGDIKVLHSVRGKLQAKNIIYTPQTPRITFLKPFRFKPFVHYTVAAHLENDALQKFVAYNLESPCHRFISYDNGGTDFLVLRGEDHELVKGKKREVHFNKLKNILENNFSHIGIYAKWSYVYYKSIDGNVKIGRTDAPGVYIAAGYNPDGMILATLSSLILSDLIINGNNKYEKLFKE